MIIIKKEWLDDDEDIVDVGGPPPHKLAGDVGIGGGVSVSV